MGLSHDQFRLCVCVCLKHLVHFFYDNHEGADDDLDAIAMHEMGSERMGRHHHPHVDHHRHPREFFNPDKSIRFLFFFLLRIF